MLDFAKLKTPAENGATLVVPDPTACRRAAAQNAAALDASDVRIAATPLAHWRRATRRRLLPAADQPVIMTGHQPAFIHPGVWAKHVVAQSLARAIGGRAVNLIVDNDAPSETTIAVPSLRDGQVTLARIPYTTLPHGHAYEQIPRFDNRRTDRLRDALRDVLQDRFDSTQLPLFFDAFDHAKEDDDWVDQAITGRRAIEARLGVTPLDRRMSRCGWEPLLVEIVTNAARFRSAYNNALAEYRRRHRVRGHQHPIPDLAGAGERCELPVWAYRRGEARRRVYVTHGPESVRLDAEGEHVAEHPFDALAEFAHRPMQLAADQGWRLRPRALMLTLWARLFLADLFIHGIGGAKYDRITDLLIADYFGMEPPKMACVSATLWLDLPRRGVTLEDLRRRRRALRDAKWNPHRYVPIGVDVGPWLRERTEAIQLCRELRRERRPGRARRRAAFERIRRINREMHTRIATEKDAWIVALERAVDEYRQDEIAQGREYFFGLYTTPNLQRLIDALPDERSFRV